MLDDEIPSEFLGAGTYRSEPTSNELATRERSRSIPSQSRLRVQRKRGKAARPVKMLPAAWSKWKGGRSMRKRRFVRLYLSMVLVTTLSRRIQKGGP